MALDTWEKMQEVFSNVIKEVVEATSERAKKLLQQHINTDTYGINKTAENVKGINELYLNGTGTPSYEFRDKAWDVAFKEALSGYLFSLFYDGNKLTAPSSSSPYLHGNANTGEDRRVDLPELLNVSGIAPRGDFNDKPGQKLRDPFWDNFEEDLKKSLGRLVIYRIR